MNRIALRRHLEPAPGRLDTWTRRLRAWSQTAAETARTPHAIQLMPIRMTVVRPQRGFRRTVRGGLIELGLIGGASAVTWYLCRHPERTKQIRDRIAGTSRSMMHRHATHNGGGDRNQATRAVQDHPVPA